MKHIIAFCLWTLSGFLMAQVFPGPWTWRRVIVVGAWIGLIVGIAQMVVGCGGEAFTVGDAIARLDAGALDDAQPVRMSSPSDDNGGDAAPRVDAPRSDPPVEAGAVLEHDAGATMTSPATDAGSEPDQGQAPAVDAGPPPPPPALCCMTPCQGSAVAPITCGNGPAWTCAAGSCAERACAVGATCTWMGPACTGRVAVCP